MVGGFFVFELIGADCLRKNIVIKIWTCRKFALTLHRKTHGTMAEWLGIGLQNRAQQFDSAWYLTKPRRELHGEAFCVNNY